MCNITFEVPRFSTFVFKRSSEKNIFKIRFVGKSPTGFGWNNVGPASQHGPIAIGPTLFHNWANVLCYPGSGLSGHKASPVGQSEQTVSMLGQRRIRLTSIEAAMGCDAGPTLNRYWLGRPTLCVPGTSYRPVH